MNELREAVTQEMVRELLDYDAESGVMTWRRRHNGTPQWNARYAGTRAGNKTTGGYIAIQVAKRLYLAHRLAWLWVYGQWPQGEMDHINCVKDDNRITNLRLATRGQNEWNKHTNSRNSSGFKGVTSRDGRRWSAKIRDNYRIIRLGNFDTPEEAHEAYAEAAKALRGDFARTS